MTAATATAKYRALKFGVTRVAAREANGHTYVSAEQPLEMLAARLTERLLLGPSMPPTCTRAFVSTVELQKISSRLNMMHRQP